MITIKKSLLVISILYILLLPHSITEATRKKREISYVVNNESTEARFMKDVLPPYVKGELVEEINVNFSDESLLEEFEIGMDKFLTHNRIWALKITYDMKMECVKKGLNDTCNLISKNQPYIRTYSIQRITTITRDERLLFDRLYKLQFPKIGCKNRAFIMFTLPPYGLGSVLHLTEWPLKHGIRLDRTVLLNGKEFSYHPSGGDISAFTLPFTSCELSDIKNKKLFELNSTQQNTVITFSWPPKVFARTPEPSEQWKHHSNLWWVSFVGLFVLQPNRMWRQYNHNLLVDMYRKGFLNPSENTINDGPVDCIAIHVRHGDKTTEAKLLDLSAYMIEAKRLVDSGLASNRIFIMSDDNDVIHGNTKRYSNKFKFYWLDEPRYNGAAQAILGTEGFDRIETGMRVLSQVRGSAETCKYFIGTTTSNISRFVREFMVMMYGEDNIVNSGRWISLDGTWETLNNRNW